MNKSRNRSYLNNGVATSILGAVVLIGAQNSAQAGSICTADTVTSPDNFSCVDELVSPAASASGSYTDGAAFAQGANGGFEIVSSGSLAVALNGDVNASSTSDPGLTTVVALSTSDALNFTSEGVISGTSDGWLYSLWLRGESSVTASTGEVTADGWRATGVYSETQNGDNLLTGGTTLATGTWSRGLFTDAFNGNNVTNTGVVTAVGDLSRAVIARSMSTPDGCPTDGSQSTTVNVTGDVSANYVGITTLTCGNSTVNVLQGNTVSVSSDDSYAILTMATLSTVTQIDGNVFASSTGGRAFETRSGSSTTAIGGTGTVVGTITGGDGDDTLSIASGGVWTSSATSDFKTGVDSVSNAGSMTVNAGHFANLESFANSGTMSITGGSFQLSGATSFVNSGTIQIAPGNTTITSDAALFNDGTISLQNGQAGDVLTIANDYVAGPSATLLLDVSESASDNFVVNGTTTGTTQILVNASAATLSSAMRIGTSDSAAGTFVVDGSDPQSGIRVSLARQSLTRLIDLRLLSQGNALYVAAAPNSVAFQPLTIGGIGRDLWHHSADVVSSNLADRHDLGSADHSKRTSLWGQLYAASERSGTTDTRTAFSTEIEIDNHLRTDRTGAQVGVDVAIGRFSTAGVTAGYERAVAEYREDGGKLKADGFNIGGYARVGQQVGPFANVLLKYDWSSARLTNAAFDLSDGDPDMNSLGARVEAGMRWQSRAQRIALAGQLAYVDTSVDGFYAEGIDYKFADSKSLRGALAARVDFGKGILVPFVEARVSHEFHADGSVTLASGSERDSVRAGGRGTWVKLEAGFGSNASSGPNLAAWINAGDVRGVGLRAGWRF